MEHCTDIIFNTFLLKLIYNLADILIRNQISEGREINNMLINSSYKNRTIIAVTPEITELLTIHRWGTEYLCRSKQNYNSVGY